MKRRTFLPAAAAALALPSVARAQSKTTLTFMPEQDLASLDPHSGAQYTTRNHGYMIFDTLYGQDAAGRYSFQMLSGHSIENDGRLWNLTLRDGLFWHDGERVLARDCVASILRWSKRDPLGDALMAATEELSAPDDRTIRFRLKKPFPLLPEALGKSTTPMPAMMPERVAQTDPFKQITEIIGSGPFRYKADERVSGSRNVYERFDRYRPREDGKTEWTAGPKIVHYDRVLWTTMPDPATASGALQKGEADWWEFPPVDLQSQLRKNPKIKVTVLDPNGGLTLMRPNHLNPPFNNPAIRRAFFAAIDQVEFMQAIVGSDPELYHTPLGYFCPNTPMASEAGLEPLLGPRDYGKAREMLKRAGYAGEKVLYIYGGNITEMRSTGEVMADLMHRVGLNVETLNVEGAVMLQKRTSKEPIERGGWSAFTTGLSGSAQLSPPAHLALRGNGNAPNAWPGWCVSPEIERLRDAWLDAPDLASQKDICRRMQLQAMEDVPYYPLGQFRQPTAYRTAIGGMPNGFAMFWGVRPV